MISSSIEKLLSEGKYSAAIASLTEENRRHRDAAKEKLLAELRLTGFRNSPANANSDWPPSYHNPFKNSPGIPEIYRSELSLDTLAGGILDHGSLIVRNLISKQEVSNLVNDIDCTLSAMQASQVGTSAAKTSPWFAPPVFLEKRNTGLKRKFINEAGGTWAIDSPRTIFDIFEQYNHLGLKNLLTAYFGETPCLSARKWVLRRSYPLSQESDWHQDGAFMGADARSVNLWIALSHCGGDSDKAAIDLLPKRLDHIVPTGMGSAKLDWSVSPEYVNQHFVDPAPVSPRFAPGDAVFFDHFNLHRTSYSPSKIRERYAMECWFFAPTRFFASSRYSEDQIPILF